MLTGLFRSMDYEETFSPIAQFETMRVFLALAAQLPVYQFDVKSAIWNGDLDEEVKHHVRGIARLILFFIENGFIKSKNEHTLFVKKAGKNDFLMVCPNVDDMIYMGSSIALIDEFKSCMMNKFEMSDLGPLQYFLGLEVLQKEDGI
nr:reverse transcriptase [Tanacetum cinerariifolium]